MNPESCPKPDELRSFVRCSLSESEADSISEHLERCPTCEETVVGLERDGDTIAERIKQAAAQPTFAHEPECQQMLQSLLDAAGASPVESPSAGVGISMAQSLRDYQIVAKLGEGGMGTVYKAVHQRLKKTVALKVLPTNRIGDQPAVARFEREMEVLGQLNHPHIVQALDAGEHDGQHYLVMEYVEGCDLSEIVKRCSPLSIADACLLISQAAEGLQYAHEHGFVHRDIKPSNLMLATGAKPNATVVVKILDLGLARALDQRPDAAAPKADLTTTGQVMGTLDYMAPEQGGDAHQVDIRADIYSLGATLYKLLTGDSPYAEHAQKPPLQRLMAIAQFEPPAIRTKRTDIPEKLAAIVHRMLAKQPVRRFALPADVVQALAPYCAGADLAALVVSSGATRINEAKTATTRPLAAATAQSGAARRLRTMLAGLAAFFVLAAVIVIATRNGTVEVTAPNGELPKDVKVVVTRGGDDVEVLQVDNHWSAKIVNGEYQVELRSGQDRFEIADSKLTVSRMGRSLVTLNVRKQVKESTPASDASVVAKPIETTKAESSKPVPVPLESPRVAGIEKPFTVLRKGKPARDFKTWGGMLGVLEAGDTIEVQGRGPYALPNPPFNDVDVTVRAAAGSRPELQLAGSNTHRASLKLDGIDLVVRHGDRGAGGFTVWSANPDTRVSLEITNSRVKSQGISVARGASLKVTDSVMLLHGIVIQDNAEAEFNNNVVMFFTDSFCFGFPDDGSRLRLTNNTIVATQDHGGGVSLLTFGKDRLPKKPVRVEARNNLFALDGGAFGQGIFAGETPDKNAAAMDWQGEGNLYCPYPRHGLKSKDSDEKEVVGHPLDAWASHLSRTEREPNSQIAPWPHWTLAEPRWSEDVDYLATLRKQIEAVIPPESRGEVGPQWDLIGPGDAYVRALAAAGTPVDKKDLLPEALPGGPCVLLRNGQEVRGFLTLQEAISAAMGDDVIELRTNHNVGDASHQEGNRLLTIRAGAGFSPEVGNLRVTQGCRAILAGLRFAPEADLKGGASQTNGSPGQFVRIANCSFRTRNVVRWAEVGAISIWDGTGDQDHPLVIQNCWSGGTVVLRARPDQPTRFENCIAPFVTLSLLRPEDQNTVHRIEFDRCALWAPEPQSGRGGLLKGISNGPRRVEVVAHRTLFESSASLRQYGSPLRWQGTKNLFRLGDPDWFHGAEQPGPSLIISGLDELRTAFKSDVDSVESHPLAWEPEQWKLLPTSPGFQAGPEGQDIGADIDRLTKALGL